MDTLKEEKLRSKETIVHLLILESASLCPLEHIVFFPSFPLLCELVIERWRIEVGGGPDGGLGFSGSQKCRQILSLCISDLLIEISFNVQFMCILNMNIESMDVFNCLYMVDYICYNISNTFIYIMLSLFDVT